MALQGTVIYGGGGPLHCEIDSIDDARTALRRLKAYGAFSAKSYNQPCRAARQQLLQVLRSHILLPACLEAFV
jgi:hypothetical protein